MSGGEEADDELDALMAQYTATAEAERAAALAQEQQRKPRLKKHEREAQERQQALDKPLGHDTKGFQLLSKMGFQPGQGLGRAKQGRVEPLPLHVKQTKTGVGVDEANRAAKRAAQQQEAARATKRVHEAEASREAFRGTQAAAFQLRQLHGQLHNAKAACSQLDEAAGIVDNPLLREDEEEEEGEGEGEGAAGGRAGGSHPRAATAPTALSEEEGLPATCTRKAVAPEEQGVRRGQGGQQPSQDVPGLQAQLDELLGYLRGRHCYCLYCGCSYDSAEQLAASCPGVSEQDHEG